MSLHLSFLALFIACSPNASQNTRPTPPTSSAEPVAQEPASDPMPDSTASANDVTLAEHFVEQQGYTDLPPTRSAFRPETEEERRDPETTLRRRHGTLLPYAIEVRDDHVLFSPIEFGESARAVRVSPELIMENRTMRWSATPMLEVLARVVTPPVIHGGCGILHLASPAEYEIIEVTRGEYNESHLMAVYGCPELSRAHYASIGTTETYEPGAIHRLVLAESMPVNPPAGPSLMDSQIRPNLNRYWVIRSDPATP